MSGFTGSYASRSLGVAGVALVLAIIGYARADDLLGTLVSFLGVPSIAMSRPDALVRFKLAAALASAGPLLLGWFADLVYRLRANRAPGRTARWVFLAAPLVAAALGVWLRLVVVRSSVDLSRPLPVEELALLGHGFLAALVGAALAYGLAATSERPNPAPS